MTIVRETDKQTQAAQIYLQRGGHASLGSQGHASQASSATGLCWQCGGVNILTAGRRRADGVQCVMGCSVIVCYWVRV